MGLFNVNQTFDFYDKTNLKSYNLDEKMRYQLRCLDSLDVFTRKHCENVASLTCRICEYLHCNKNFTEYCTICAYMHDIGKIFIPPAILQKPGKLTDEEYEVMKTHTTIGYEMCAKDEKLRNYRAGPIYHHEALNGTGYPKGLTKPDIPYEGQIIRVADEYDAITSKRQYKTHIGVCETLEILIENTKSQNKEMTSSEALKHMKKMTQLGKDNPIIVKALFKVIIDDISYEIYCTQNYIDNLGKELKRFEQVEKYRSKMESAKKQQDKEYYYEGMKQLLIAPETVDNYREIRDQYQKSYVQRKAAIENLYEEIKRIKKMKV